MGKKAIDDNCKQTGQMLKDLFNCQQATLSSKIEDKDGNIAVLREIDEGLENK